jgi:hypothetical protein
VVNLKNRMDPGPLFPMKAWRLEIFDRETPAIRLYRVIEPADIYEHLGSKPPHPNHPSHGKLPENCMIQMRDEMGDWLLVRPLIGNLSEQVGWVQKKNIKVLSSGKMKTNTEVQLFVDNDGPPLRQLSIGQLDPDTQVRIQVEQGPWALLANPVMDTPQRWIEEWVPRDHLEEIM